MKISKFIFLACICSQLFPLSEAYEIVYPKSQKITIQSPTSFFVGNENPQSSLTINSEPVDIHYSGGFFHPIKLNLGENIFNISNGEQTTTYKIIRTEPKLTKYPEKIIEFSSSIIVKTIHDGVALRSLPTEHGFSRLQHLDKGVKLEIIGEFNGFYQVQLARDDFAWISKNNVVKLAEQTQMPAKIKGYFYEETPQKRIFTLKLSKRVPYVLSESNGLDLVVYNIDGYYENKYVFHINPMGPLFGYKAYYNNDNELIIEVKKVPKIDKTNPLKNIKITLDPGHGGNELGAIGCLGNPEKEINLAISLKLRDLMQEKGATVYLTRNSNKIEKSLSDRVLISQKANSDIFISIHNNAIPDNSAYLNKSGSSAFYFYPQSKPLAKSIQSAMINELELKDDNVKWESFAVIRNTASPSVLLEVGYMIMPEDNAKLINPEFQFKAAEAILHGVENYLNELQ